VKHSAVAVHLPRLSQDGQDRLMPFPRQPQSADGILWLPEVAGAAIRDTP
jgi:hypothetical protein